MITVILPLTIITTIVFMMMKFLKCLWLMEYVDIDLLRPANLPLTIVEFKLVVTMVEVNLGLNKTDTVSIKIVEFIILVLMV